MPTLREFLARATSPPYNCKEKETNLPVIGPIGPDTWKYLERGGKVTEIPRIGLDEQLTAQKLKTMVADLNLPPTDFWLVF